MSPMLYRHRRASCTPSCNWECIINGKDICIIDRFIDANRLASVSIYEFMNELKIHLIQVLNFLQTPAQHLPAYFILCPLKKGFVWCDHLLGNNVKARLCPGFRGKATKLDITHVVHGAPCSELPSHIFEDFPALPL